MPPVPKFAAISVPRFLPIAFSLAAAGALVTLAAPPAYAEEPDSNSDESEAPEMTKGEKKLAKMLEGRVAGEPQRCIRSFDSRHLRTIDKTAYVYGSGRTIYVQRTKHPEDIDRDDVLVVDRFGSSQLCRLDMTKTIDRTSGIFTGAVFMEDFVPYTRVEEASNTGTSETPASRETETGDS